MQDFHYSYIKNEHAEKTEILEIGIDRLMYKVEAQNVYANFHKDKVI